MRCVRCGYCCKQLWVIIVDDPKLGVVEGNLISHNGEGIPCKHLRGDKPGEYWCAVHNEPWYKETGCYAYDQISASPDDVCRIGEYIMNKEREK